MSKLESRAGAPTIGEQTRITSNNPMMDAGSHNPESQSYQDKQRDMFRGWLFRAQRALPANHHLTTDDFDFAYSQFHTKHTNAEIDLRVLLDEYRTGLQRERETAALWPWERGFAWSVRHYEDVVSILTAKMSEETRQLTQSTESAGLSQEISIYDSGVITVATARKMDNSEIRQERKESHKGEAATPENRSNMGRTRKGIRIEKLRKPVYQYTKDFVFVASYGSQGEAAKAIGIAQANISRVLHNAQKTAGGFIWLATKGQDIPVFDRNATKVKSAQSGADSVESKPGEEKGKPFSSDKQANISSDESSPSENQPVFDDQPGVLDPVAQAKLERKRQQSREAQRRWVQRHPDLHRQGVARWRKSPKGQEYEERRKLQRPSSEKQQGSSKQPNSEHKQKKPINQFAKDGTLIATYGSQAEAAKAIGTSRQNVSQAIHNAQKTAGGFIWKVAEQATELDEQE